MENARNSYNDEIPAFNEEIEIEQNGEKIKHTSLTLYLLKSNAIMEIIAHGIVKNDIKLAHFP